MSRIATYNVNSVKARLNRLTEWLDRTAPDIVLLQETKSTDADFPRTPFEERGYTVTPVGQKTYNGVAILARDSVEDVIDTLPGDASDTEARYVEAVVGGRLRVASVYVPMGQAVDSDKFTYKLDFLARLYERARTLLAWEEAFVLAGDYNVAPEPADVHDPEGCRGDVLFSRPERAALRAIQHLGLTDALRTMDPRPGLFTWWHYRGGAWQKDTGYRLDHLLLSPQATDRLTAAGVDKGERGREKASDHAPVWCDLTMEAAPAPV